MGIRPARSWRPRPLSPDRRPIRRVARTTRRRPLSIGGRGSRAEVEDGGRWIARLPAASESAVSRHARRAPPDPAVADARRDRRRRRASTGRSRCCGAGRRCSRGCSPAAGRLCACIGACESRRSSRRSSCRCWRAAGCGCATPRSSPSEHVRIVGAHGADAAAIDAALDAGGAADEHARRAHRRRCARRSPAIRSSARSRRTRASRTAQHPRDRAAGRGDARPSAARRRPWRPTASCSARRASRLAAVVPGKTPPSVGERVASPTLLTALAVLGAAPAPLARASNAPTRGRRG